MHIVVLDDYQNVAAGYADWQALGAEITFVSRRSVTPMISSRRWPAPRLSLPCVNAPSSMPNGCHSFRI